MMGMPVEPAQLFYEFRLDDDVPPDHLLRRIDRFLDLESVRSKLTPIYSTIGRPSIDPELMMRMLLVGYCMGIRFTVSVTYYLVASLIRIATSRLEAAGCRGHGV